MEILPLKGIGRISFGAKPSAARSEFGTEMLWEPWMGGNRNDALFYRGIALTFDSCDAYGPLEAASLVTIEVTRAFPGSFLGTALASFNLRELPRLVAANGGPLVLYPNGSMEARSLNTRILFATDERLEILTCWHP